MIRAIYSFIKAKATVDYIKPTVAASSVNQKFVVQFPDIKPVFAYTKAAATDVRLDPSSLNQWLRGDSISLSDAAPLIEYLKTFNESITPADSATVATTYVRSETDSISVADSLTALLTYHRDAADSVTFSDSSSWDFGGNYTESVSFSDSSSYSLATAKSDSFSVADSAPSFEISLTQGALSDSFTPSEQASVAVSPAQFSDSFSVSESVTAGLLVTQDFADAFSLSDNLSTAFGYGELASDSFSLSESPSVAIGFGRNASDSFSVSESISTQLIIGTSSQFNRSAFNVAQFNQ